MSINIEKLNKLNELVSVEFRRKHLIVLDPEEKNEIEENDITENEITYDLGKWNISDELYNYIDRLSVNSTISIEDKILLIYEKICKEYVYDDNLISYIKKVDDDMFSLPDWYGRDVDQEWEKNREQHNRRICFELSRYLAKSLRELLKDNEEYNTCILWNKNLTHYLVGLTCDDYSLALDLDDFFQIKDLTRLKSGLTAEGIVILEDRKNKFKDALNKFNEGRSEYAIKKVEDDINAIKPRANIENQEENKGDEENEDIIFFEKVMEILVNEYNIDSQGIYEYMKEIVDIRLGSEGREKIWKKIKGDTKESTRYIRCLMLNIGKQKYLIDVDKKIVRQFNEKELTEKRTKFIPYKDLARGGYDYYDGT